MLDDSLRRSVLMAFGAYLRRRPTFSAAEPLKLAVGAGIRRGRRATKRAEAVTRALVVVLGLGASAAPLAAQTLVLNVGDSARVQVPPATKLTVPLKVDLTAATGTNLASVQGRLTWAVSALTLDSVRAAGTAGWTVTANTDSAAAGIARVSSSGTAALAASGTIAALYFTAGASVGGTRLGIAPNAAENHIGQSVLSQLQWRALDACVAPSGVWGDVNDDGVVNVIDAQQIARYSVGLSVANAAALAARGDVTADGTVNIIDAQQIARFSVALSTALRVNTPLFAPPAVASVVVSAVGAPTVMVGNALQFTATPTDASGASIAGCPPITWLSSNPAGASVSRDGLATGFTSGTTTITATSRGRSGTLTLSITPSPPPVDSVTVVAYGDSATKISIVNIGTTTSPPVTVVDAVTRQPATDPTLKFSSRAPSVAVVDTTGAVTAVGAGETWIDATNRAGSGDSVFVIVPRNATGPILRTDLTTYSPDNSAGVTVRVILDTRSGPSFSAITAVVSMSPFIYQCFDIVASNGQLALVVSADSTHGVIRLTAASVNAVSGAIELIRLKFHAGCTYSASIYLSASEMLAADLTDLLPAATMSQYPIHLLIPPP